MFRLGSITIPILILTTACCVSLYHIQKQTAWNNITEELHTVASMRGDNVAQWRDARLDQTVALTQRPLLMERISAWLTTPNANPDEMLSEALRAAQPSDQYSDLYVVDSQTTIRWSRSGVANFPSPELYDLVRQVLADAKAIMTDINTGPNGPLPQVTVITPLKNAATGNVLGALISIVNLETTLYPLLYTWPTTSSSAETYLVRQLPGAIQYISPLRLDKNFPPLTTVPLTQKENSAIAAIESTKKSSLASAGLDYRGVAVATIAVPIKGSTWHLIAEIDQDEALNNWHRNTFEAISVFIAFVLLATLATTLTWQRKRHQHLREIESASAELARMNGLYNMLSHTNKLIISAKNQEELLEGITRISVQYGGFRFAWVGLTNAEGKIIPVARAGDDHDYIDNINATTDPAAPNGKGPAALTTRTGTPHVYNDFLTTMKDSPWAEALRNMGIHSSGTFPILQRGSVIAILNLYSDEVGFFGEDARETIGEMVGDISFALDSLLREAERLHAIADKQRLSEQLAQYLSTSPVINYALRQTDSGFAAEWISDNIENLLGYTVDEAMNPGWWQQNLHPDDREDAQASMLMLSKHDSLRHEYRFRQKKGDYIWLLDNMKITRNDTGEILQAVGAWTDITEQRTMLEALRASEERYHDLFEHNPHAMYMHDQRTCQFIAVNEAALKRFGYTRNEFLSMTLGDIHPTENYPAPPKPFEEYGSGFTHLGIRKHQLRDGTTILVELSKQSLVIKGRPAELVLSEDVTDRVRAEQALRESEERLRLALSSAGQGTIDIDIPSGEAKTSTEYALILGHNPVNFQESKDRWLARIHPQDRDATIRAYEECIDGTSDEFRAEFRQADATGNWRWTLTVGKVVERSATGDALRFIGTLMDVSTSKHNEELLRLQSTSLEAAANSIVITDLNGTLIWANPAFTRMTGYTPQEYLGHSPREFPCSKKNDPDIDREMWETVLSGQTWHGEWINHRKDGRPYHEQTSITPVRDATGTITHFVAIKQDVTEIRRTQRQLAASQSRYRRILETIPIPVACSDTSGRVTFLNDRFTKVLGYTIADVPTLNDWWEKAYPDPKYRQWVLEAWEDTTRRMQEFGEDTSPKTFDITCKNGDHRSVIVSTTDIEDEMVVVFVDLSERLRAEEKLRSNEAYLREGEQLARTGACHIDPSSGQATFTPGVCSMLGYPEDYELTLDQIYTLVLPEYRNCLRNAVEHCIAFGGTRAGQFEIRTANGQHLWIDGRLVADESNSRTRLITGAIKDITESHRAAIALSESKDRLNYLIEVSPAIIYTRRPGEIFVIEFVSPKVQHAFGYTPQDYQHNPSFWSSHIHPDDEAHVLENMQALMDHDRAIAEYRFQCADGDFRWIHDELVLLRDTSGNPIEIIGAWMDVTERKRVAELEVAKCAAEAANSAKSSFLATMSHEIRTPMNGVIGATDVLRQTRLANDQYELVEIIRDSAHSLLSIINDILDFSKIEAGKMEIEFSPVAVEPLLDSLCAVMGHLASTKNIRVYCFTDPNIPDTVLSDTVRLRQILSNLLGNALKFSRDDSDPPWVKIRADWEAPGKILFSVADNGIGMNSQAIANLFQPFTQADGSIIRRFGGTGLGLSICRSLVSMLGGTISVESLPNMGSTFTVSLPVKEIESPSTGSEFHRNRFEAPDLHGLHCLIITDNPPLANDWVVYLKHSGVETVSLTTVAHCEASCASLSERADALVIFDGVRQHSLQTELWECISTRFKNLPTLFVHASGRKRIAEERSGGVSIHGEVLSRETFLQGVGIATRRLAPTTTTLNLDLPESIEAPSIEEALEQGRLILVAEDNEINQRVFHYQLALLGYAAEIAENGEEALKCWRSKPYALLLTDLHMPHMDGYALAAAIRKEEATGEHLPIIAYTANISRGESERCKAEGMDDYLVKPVPMEVLKRVLEQWMPRRAVPGAPPRDPGAPPHCLPAKIPAGETLDVSVLAALIGNEPEVLSTFLGDYMGSVSKAAGELKVAVAQDDLPRVAAIMHRLKSSSRSVGALHMGDCCERLERAGNTGDASAVSELLPEFDLYVDQTICAIIAYGKG